MPKRRSDELAAIDEVMPLVDRFNELEHAQRMIFLDMVDPLPEEEPTPTKKPQKKSTKKASGKSRRAQELSNTVRQGLQRREPTVGGFADDADMQRCSDCGAVSDDNVHHKQSDPNYHPFVSRSNAQPATVTSPQPAPARDDSFGVNLEIGQEDVGSAQHAARGGD